MLVITSKSAYAVRALAELARRGSSPVPIGEVAARRDISPQFLESLFVTLRQIAAEGRTVIFISHKLHEVLEVADRITVLRLGRNAGIFERAKTTQQEVVQAITAGIPTKVAGIPETAPELAS